MNVNIDKLKEKFNLDYITDKLFSGKIDKKDIKQNFLLNLTLLLRHFIVTHKNLVLAVLIGIGASIIFIALYISSYEKNINEANKWFEVSLSYYRRAFIEKDLSPEERVQSLNESINRFQYVINTFSSTPLKYDSLMYQANAYYEIGDYNNAVAKYQELINKKSKFYFADFVLINVAKCYEQLNNIQGAMTAYQSIINDYPDKPAVPEAKFNLAKLKELTNKVNEAFQDYQNLITDFPQSMWAREARRRILFLQTLIRTTPQQQRQLPQPAQLTQPSPNTPGTPQGNQLPNNP